MSTHRAPGCRETLPLSKVQSHRSWTYPLSRTMTLVLSLMPEWLTGGFTYRKQAPICINGASQPVATVTDRQLPAPGCEYCWKCPKFWTMFLFSQGVTACGPRSSYLKRTLLRYSAMEQ